MRIKELADLLDADILVGGDNLDLDVFSACGSDMMSDVLAFVKEQAVLLTGLVNSQVIRTCQMMDMRGIVFVRGKVPTQEMTALAKENGLFILTTKERMYNACGILYSHGLRGGDAYE